VIDVAFGELGAPALFAGHHPENASSRRTLETLGFRYVQHELYPPTGLQHPCYVLAP
jgi:[ribosomal protein S5]-alanine N-acetyltransferase